jgi:hypothetical protein
LQGTRLDGINLVDVLVRNCEHSFSDKASASTGEGLQLKQQNISKVSIDTVQTKLDAWLE